MNLFYSPPETVSGELITLGEDESRHAAQVLRAKEGERLHVTDGCGHRHTCEIISIAKRSMQLRIVETVFTPKPVFPVLAVGLLKSRDRLEWMVEKSVELGIDTLVLMHTERSERGHVREDRLRGIQISAMKQCLSDWLPDLKVTSLEQTLRMFGAGRPVFIAHEKTDVSDRYSPSGESSPLLLVGPEGGFSETEVAQCVKAGARAVSLGPRRLRTETAALVMVARIPPPCLHGGAGGG